MSENIFIESNQSLLNTTSMEMDFQFNEDRTLCINDLIPSENEPHIVCTGVEHCDKSKIGYEMNSQNLCDSELITCT